MPKVGGQDSTSSSTSEAVLSSHQFIGLAQLPHPRIAQHPTLRYSRPWNHYKVLHLSDHMYRTAHFDYIRMLYFTCLITPFTLILWCLGTLLYWNFYYYLPTYNLFFLFSVLFIFSIFIQFRVSASFIFIFLLDLFQILPWLWGFHWMYLPTKLNKSEC